MARQCKGSWLDTYLQYTHNQESPTAFHEWVGLSILSAAVGRNIWVARPKYTLYLNLFVILVAGSAKCKKSTSIRIGENLLRQIDNPPEIFAQKITPEAIIQTLEDAKKSYGTSTGIICADELSLFMGRDATKMGIVPVLMSLYDGRAEWVYRTVGRGKEVLKEATLTILAGTTPTDLKEIIPVRALESGFAARIIFVYQDSPSKTHLFDDLEEDKSNGVKLKETPYEEELKKALVHDLTQVRKLGGKMMFRADAKAFALDWYKQEQGTTRDKKVEGYFARKHDTMFKVAGLLSLSQSSSRYVEQKHIEKALAIFAENEQYLGPIVAHITTTELGGATEAIYEIIKKAGKIQHTELLHKCWRETDAKGLADIIRTLIESGEIEQVLSGDNRTRSYKVKWRR